jgi:hypothetical protein
MKVLMKSAFRSFVLAALIALAGSLPAFAQSRGVPGPQDYNGFSQFITDRNIFDPNRVPHYYTGRPFHPRPRPGRTPGIQFVGTMSYEKGMFAFFYGNNSEDSKVLQVGSMIENYTITEITTTKVVLVSTNQQQLPLQVGDGLRQDNGYWVLAQPGDMVAASGPSESAGSSSNGSSSSTPAPPASTGEQNDVLKRLMQLREKENQ